MKLGKGSVWWRIHGRLRVFPIGISMTTLGRGGRQKSATAIVKLAMSGRIDFEVFSLFEAIGFYELLIPGERFPSFRYATRFAVGLAQLKESRVMIGSQFGGNFQRLNGAGSIPCRNKARPNSNCAGS